MTNRFFEEGFAFCKAFLPSLFSSRIVSSRFWRNRAAARP